jgi:hypothetical protein
LTTSHLAADERHPDAPLRRILLLLVLVGALGLGLELLLLEHFEDVLQWTPLVLLGMVIVVTLVVTKRPTRRAIRIFQGLMLLCVGAGVLGVYLHYRGNVEFEREGAPARRGLALFWEAIRGATPALAPGALGQLGLIGLASTFRHPALRHSPCVRRRGADVDHGATR